LPSRFFWVGLYAGFSLPDFFIGSWLRVSKGRGGYWSAILRLGKGPRFRLYPYGFAVFLPFSRHPSRSLAFSLPGICPALFPRESGRGGRRVKPGCSAVVRKEEAWQRRFPEFVPILKVEGVGRWVLRSELRECFFPLPGKCFFFTPHIPVFLMNRYTPSSPKLNFMGA